MRAIKQEGVDTLFTLCGGHVQAIYDSCLNENVKVIDVRHEQVAGHAAEGWSRATRRCGVAVVTAGPGVTDSVTGVANAWRANSPILVIGGQGPFVNTGRGSLQEMDHVALMKPITKWAGTCYDTERIPEYIELAVRHAVTGIPGPAFLEIPMDILMNDVNEDNVVFPPIRTTPPLISPQRDEALKAIEILEQVKRPMLMAGTSVKWSNAQQSLQNFLDKTKIPAYANGGGRGVNHRDSPLLFQRTRRDAVQECD